MPDPAGFARASPAAPGAHKRIAMTEKHYLNADDLLHDSFRLGLEVYRAGFRPDLIIGIWRGGTPVGIAVQEILQSCGIVADHTAIRTASYTGIGARSKTVQVHGLDYILERVDSGRRLLIVDDVFDTGLSVQAVLAQLRQGAGAQLPADIRIATPWFKPANNQTPLKPDFYLHETDKWLVFPHEIQGLSPQEIAAHKPALARLYQEYGL